MSIEENSEFESISLKEPVKSNAYQYIDANDGQVGVSVIETTANEHLVVLHFAKRQFQIDTSRDGLNTIVVNNVLASVELDLEAAKSLHDLLGKMLPKA